MNVQPINMAAIPLGHTKEPMRFGKTKLATAKEKKGWKKPPLYKRLWHHRYNLVIASALLSGSTSLYQTCFSEKPQVVTTKTDEVIETKNTYKSDFPTAGLLFCLSLLGLTLLIENSLHKIANCNQPENRRKSAFHEVGHLLAFLQAKHYPGVPEFVQLNEEGFGVKPGDVMHPDKTSPNYQQAMQDLYADALLVFNAGMAMEQLIQGYDDPLSGGSDYAQMVEFIKLFIETAKRNPKTYAKAMKLWMTRATETKKILMQYDRHTVEQLVDKLVTEKYWDQNQLKEIVAEFNLASS